MRAKQTHQGGYVFETPDLYYVPKNVQFLIENCWWIFWLGGGRDWWRLSTLIEKNISD